MSVKQDTGDLAAIRIVHHIASISVTVIQEIVSRVFPDSGIITATLRVLVRTVHHVLEQLAAARSAIHDTLAHTVRNFACQKLVKNAIKGWDFARYAV